MAGVSERNLPFAPADMPQTVSLGSIGNTTVVGHRDTQVNVLKQATTETCLQTPPSGVFCSKIESK